MLAKGNGARIKGSKMSQGLPGVDFLNDLVINHFSKFCNNIMTKNKSLKSIDILQWGEFLHMKELL